jgi:hypothetical protein
MQYIFYGGKGRGVKRKIEQEGEYLLVTEQGPGYAHYTSIAIQALVIGWF